MKIKSSLFIACHSIRTLKVITVSPYPAFISKQQFPFPHLLSDLPVFSGLKRHQCVCGVFVPLRLFIPQVDKFWCCHKNIIWKFWVAEERNVDVGALGLTWATSGNSAGATKGRLSLVQVYLSASPVALWDLVGISFYLSPFLNCTHSYQIWV